jgi:hypothetical protein
MQQWNPLIACTLQEKNDQRPGHPFNDRVQNRKEKEIVNFLVMRHGWIYLYEDWCWPARR